MLYPNVIAQNHQFDMRVVRVELELDILLCELQGFEELHRTPELRTPVSNHRLRGMERGCAYARLFTEWVQEQDLRFKAILKNAMQISLGVDKGFSACGPDHHDTPSHAVGVFQAGNGSLR